MTGSPSSENLADLVAELYQRIRRLEAGSSTSQLPFSSISDPRRGLVLQNSTTNLVENPSFELGDDLWDLHAFGSVGTRGMSVSTDQALFGSSSLRIQSSSLGDQDADELGAFTSFEVDPEFTVAAHANVYAADYSATSHEMFVGLVWYDSNLLEVGRVQVEFQPTVGEWSPTPVVTARVPPEISVLTLIVYVNGGGIGGPAPVDIYLDGAMVYYGSVFTSYVDGDQENSQWDGLPHASTSSRMPDPTGNRVVAASTGFKQFDAEGQQIVSIGAMPDTGETYTTIVDPETGGALSTMSNAGDFVGNSAAFTEDIELVGQSLVEYTDVAPRALEAFAQKTTHSSWSGVNTEMGIMEIQFTARAGHHYRIETPPLLTDVGAGGTSRARYRFRVTFDGSAPSIGSTQVAQSDVFHNTSVNVYWTHHETVGAIVRVLLTIQDLGGGGSGARMLAATNRPMTIDVSDLGGQAITNTGIVNDSSGGGGGTGGGGTGTRYTKRYLCSWSGSYRQNGTRRTDKGNLLYQGYVESFNGNQKSLIGFNTAAIQSDLAGATVEKVQLRLYSQHWYNNSGGTVVIGDHNRTSRPSNHPGYSGMAGDRESIGRFSMKKPELKWFNILSGNSWLPAALANGDTAGFILDASHIGTSSTYYGYFHGDNDKYEPILEITYVK